MLTDALNHKLYIGVTSDLIGRISSHLLEMHPKSYACRHGLKKLVFYGLHDRIEYAIGREKQLKSWRREKKDKLIAMVNPEWVDLILDRGDEKTYPEIGELPIDIDTRGDHWW